MPTLWTDSVLSTIIWQIVVLYSINHRPPSVRFLSQTNSFYTFTLYTSSTLKLSFRLGQSRVLLHTSFLECARSLASFRNKDWKLLRCYTLSTEDQLPTFRKHIDPRSRSNLIPEIKTVQSSKMSVTIRRTSYYNTPRDLTAAKMPQVRNFVAYCTVGMRGT